MSSFLKSSIIRHHPVHYSVKTGTALFQHQQRQLTFSGTSLFVQHKISMMNNTLGSFHLIGTLQHSKRNYSTTTNQHHQTKDIGHIPSSTQIQKKDLPLSHLRVLDLSRVLAGPYCTQLLSDLGATVIKIEPPKVGDDTRSWGPPFMRVEGEGNLHENQSGYFQCANRGKKSVTVNLKSKNGQQILHKLVANCDILIENFKVGSLEKFGLDYKSAKAINPDIIYCSITGFGQDSSKSHLPGYDFVMQAMSGVMSITGDQNTPPFKVGVAITDVITGMYAAVGILSKVIEKQRNLSNEEKAENSISTNDWIDLSLLDCNIAYLVNQATNYLQTNNSPKRIGNRHPNIAPYDLIKCKNGDIVVAVGNDAQFQRFISVISSKIPLSAPFKDLDKFATNAQRVANRKQLLEQIEAITTQYFTKEDLINELNKQEVPCGSVNTVGEALSDAQITERNMIWTFDQQEGKSDEEIQKYHHDQPQTGVRTIGNPLRFINEEHKVLNLKQYTTRPPILSEHTEEILKEIIGASDEEIQAWRKEGTI